MSIEEYKNTVTPFEEERIALLIEECGEVIQACGKILRHGFNTKYPNDETGISNRMVLEKEIGDVLNALSLMLSNDDVNNSNIDMFKRAKVSKLNSFLHLNKLEEEYKLVKVD